MINVLTLKMNNILTFKVIIIGDKSVGKSCLTIRFCDNKFYDVYNATQPLDIKQKTLVVDNEPIKLQLWDTAGEEQYFQSMTTQYFRSVNGIVLVYDMTKIQSFKSLHYWISECQQHGVETDKIPFILVGSKSDLVNETAVTTHMGKSFARQRNMKFYETNAKLDNEFEKINSIFTSLARDMKQQYIHRLDLLSGNSNGGQNNFPDNTPEIHRLENGENVSPKKKGGCC